MRIVISGRAAVYPRSKYLPSDPAAVPVTDPAVLRALDGYDAELEDDELTDDLDPPLSRAGITGGTLRFSYDAGRNELRAVTEYRVRKPLKDKQLSLLVENTVGQWSDGVGENGFEAEWDGGSGHIYPNPPGYPGGESDRDIRVEQLPD